MNIYDGSGKTVVGRVNGDYFYDNTGQAVGRMSDDHFYNNSDVWVGFVNGNYFYNIASQPVGYVKDGIIYNNIGNIKGQISELCHPRLACGATLFLLISK
jgi:hypothetical protein